jgi:hypothetical protein
MKRWDGITGLAAAVTLVGAGLLAWALEQGRGPLGGHLQGVAVINMALALIFGPLAVTLDRLLSPPGAMGLPRTHLAICGAALLVLVVNAALVRIW